MLTAGLELGTLQAEPVFQNPVHQAGFLLLGVVGHFLEEQPVGIGFDGPGAHGQTELDISLDLASVGGAIEQPELHGALGEVGVEVDAVVPSGVVVLVIDAACVVVVCPGVPGSFHVAVGADGVLHRPEKFGRHLVAPPIGTAPIWRAS